MKQSNLFTDAGVTGVGGIIPVTATRSEDKAWRATLYLRLSKEDANVKLRIKKFFDSMLYTIQQPCISVELCKTPNT